MPSALLTMRQLAQTNEISDAEIETAVSAYLANPSTGSFGLGSEFTLDLSAAVQADRWAVSVLRSYGMGERTRRTAVRNALMFAQPSRR